MKLEHLIQAYNLNKIPAKIKEQKEENGERAGVIEYCNGIAGAYLLDKEDIVIALNIFFNCLTTEDKTLKNQVTHTIKVLEIMQKTIMLLANIPQKECNMILEKLGLFNNTFKEGKQIKHLGYKYMISVVDGKLCLSIVEEIVPT